MTDTNQPGQRDFTSGTSRLNALQFLMKVFTGGMATAMVVQVEAVHGGGLSAPATVDVLPLVNEVNSLGASVPHGIVPGLPTFRYQAGASAVVLDPIVGDIGLAVFAMRDISSVKKNRAQSNPGSFRRFDFADGLYFGGFLGEEVTQYIEFLAGGAGINIVSPGPVTINGVVIDTNGNVHGPAAIIAGYGGADQVGLQTHTHPDAQGGTTGAPNAGS